MKFELIDEFKIEYPKIEIINNFYKSIVYWLTKQLYSNINFNFIKNIQIDNLTQDKCHIKLIFTYKQNTESIKIHIDNNNINYETFEEFHQLIEKTHQNITNHIDFLNMVINVIDEQNKSYQNELQRAKITKIMEERNASQNIIREQQEIINFHKAEICKLRDNALNFIKQNLTEDMGQGHVMINIVSSEYEYYLINQKNLDFKIELVDLFNWTVKYKDISFDLILIPNIHPLMVPIIEFKNMYDDKSLILHIINQPYIQKWNQFHSIVSLIKNIIQIIKNYENFTSSQNITPVIVQSSDINNFIINILIKMKQPLIIEDIPNIYDNIFIEDKRSPYEKINMMIAMSFNFSPNHEKYISQKNTCKNINIIYFSNILKYDLTQINSDLINLIYNSNYITEPIKEKLLPYVK
jgi:hypothetical protein